MRKYGNAKLLTDNHDVLPTTNRTKILPTPFSYIPAQSGW